jgi:hypothetical protein
VLLQPPARDVVNKVSEGVEKVGTLRAFASVGL